MKRFFSNLFGTKTTKTIKTRKSGFKPAMEALEDRQLMAASVIGGVLVIDGMDGRDDHVTVSTRFDFERVGSRYLRVEKVLVNSAEEGLFTFNRSQITTGRIQFDGRSGNDMFRNDTNLASTAFGGFGNDTLIGGFAFDHLEGEADHDTLEGRTGDDELLGGGGHDTYVFKSGGWQGWDWVFENAGNGIDTLDFSGSGLGVNVDLANTGVQQVNSDLWFELLGFEGESVIENVIGSNSSDTIRGNRFDNDLSGRDGNDTIEGRGGNDVLNGGAGNDTYVFSGRNLGHDQIAEAANVDTDTLDFFSYGRSVGKVQYLAFGVASKDLLNLGRTDRQVVSTGDLDLTLSSSSGIENVIGSNVTEYGWGDHVFGNSRANFIQGMGGDDALYGLNGDDTLDGGEGNDELVGGDDNDSLLGGGGRDTLYGQNGNDFLDGGNDGWVDALSGGAGADTFKRYFRNVWSFGRLRKVYDDSVALGGPFDGDRTVEEEV